METLTYNMGDLDHAINTLKKLWKGDKSYHVRFLDSNLRVYVNSDGQIVDINDNEINISKYFFKDFVYEYTFNRILTDYGTAINMWQKGISNIGLSLDEEGVKKGFVFSLSPSKDEQLKRLNETIQFYQNGGIHILYKHARNEKVKAHFITNGTWYILEGTY